MAGEALTGVVPVADRWHLVKYTREVAERILRRLAASVRALLGGRRAGPPGDGPVDDATGRVVSSCEAGHDPTREERLARFGLVRRMHREGASLRGIARALGMNLQTVQRYVRPDACPGWQPGCHRPSRLDRFDGSIRRRLADGCGNAWQILRELRATGYRGGRTMVQGRVRRLKAEAGPAGAPAPVPHAEPRPALTSLRLPAVTMVRCPDDRDQEDRQAPVALYSGDAVIRKV
jgi:hypothetical protein